MQCVRAWRFCAATGFDCLEPTRAPMLRQYVREFGPEEENLR